jgi:hypothetical protein
MDTSRSSSQSAGHIAVEGHAGVLVARIDGGPHALFDPEIAKQLKELVDRADRDPDIRAVVFTGTHPDRFLSHSDVRWLQEGGTGFPPINTRIAKLVARTARLINRVPVVRTLAGMTRLKTLLQLDSFHATFLKMNASAPSSLRHSTVRHLPSARNWHLPVICASWRTGSMSSV